MIYSINSIRNEIDKINKQNFEELGGLKMYSYKTSNFDIDKEKEKISKKLDEIEKKYTIEEFVPKDITSLGLEKKEFIAPTDDEVKLEAENSLKAEKENELEKIENTYEGKFSNLNYKIKDANIDKESDLEEAISKYKDSLRNTTNSSIKQGISRSSIYDEAVKAIEGDKDKQISIAETEFNREMERLQNELLLLEKQKQNALEAFDISYAIKLQDEIEKINKDISNKQAEVDKYNKNIDKLEEENRLAQEEANLKEQKRIEEKNKNLTEQREKLGEVGFLNQKFKEKYEVVLDFLMSLPKNVALEELTKDDYYEKLLVNYYPAIYAKISSREN